MSSNIDKLKTRKLNDFNRQVLNLRWIMKMVGKNSITLNTSEPIGPGHTYGLDKKYSLTIGMDKISFLTNANQTQFVDDVYINSCKWFQVYIYIVEMDFEMNKIQSHINDSVVISDEINDGTDGGATNVSLGGSR